MRSANTAVKRRARAVQERRKFHMRELKMNIQSGKKRRKMAVIYLYVLVDSSLLAVQSI